METLSIPNLLVVNSSSYQHYLPDDDPTKLTEEAIEIFLDGILDGGVPVYGGASYTVRWENCQSTHSRSQSTIEGRCQRKQSVKFISNSKGDSASATNYSCTTLFTNNFIVIFQLNGQVLYDFIIWKELLFYAISDKFSCKRGGQDTLSILLFAWSLYLVICSSWTLLSKEENWLLNLSE